MKGIAPAPPPFIMDIRVAGDPLVLLFLLGKIFSPVAFFLFDLDKYQPDLSIFPENGAGVRDEEIEMRVEDGMEVVLFHEIKYYR